MPFALQFLVSFLPQLANQVKPLANAQLIGVLNIANSHSGAKLPDDKIATCAEVLVALGFSEVENDLTSLAAKAGKQ